MSQDLCSSQVQVSVYLSDVPCDVSGRRTVSYHRATFARKSI